MAAKKPKWAREVIRVRNKLGLTQAEFAAKFGVAFATINRWEQGHCIPSPMAQKLMKIMLIMEDE